MKTLIKLEDNPCVKITNDLVNYLDPSCIYIPSNNDYPLKTYIRKDTYFGNYISSISGYLSDIKKVYVKNKEVKSYKIINDYKEENSYKKIKIKVTNKEELESALLVYHLDSIYHKIKAKSNIKKIIVTAIDEEVYAVKEFMILSKFYKEILATMEYIAKIFQLEEIILVTKNTNGTSIKNVKSIIGTYPNINLKLVNDYYLISCDEFLKDELNYKSEETLLLTTSDIYDIYNRFKKNKEITEQIITISGDAINKSLVINTKLGVLLSELIEKFVTFNCDVYDVYINGYLRGTKITNYKDLIITKDIDSVVFKKRDCPSSSECINCGACNKICPVNINVLKCYHQKKMNSNCTNCGLCNYICPVQIDLKNIVRGNNEEENN